MGANLKARAEGVKRRAKRLFTGRRGAQPEGRGRGKAEERRAKGRNGAATNPKLEIQNL
jgi:hypothetical protein